MATFLGLVQDKTSYNTGKTSTLIRQSCRFIKLQ